MAWNRPNRGESESFPLQRKGEASSFLKRKGFRFSLGVAVLGAAVAAWLLWPSAEPQTSDLKPQTPSLIKEVKPAVPKAAEKRKETGAERAERVRKYWADKLYTDTNGVVRYPGGLRYRGPNDKIHHDPTPPPRPRFKRFSSNQIATLLEIVPGEIPVGGMQFRKNFNEDFIASLDEKVEIYADDDANEIELKKEVERTKRELAERMKNGEDPRKICEETWNEICQMGLYRDALLKQVAEIRKDPKLTAKDVQDLVDAANLMLKEKGIKTIGISKYQLRRLAERDRQRLESMNEGGK